MSWKTELRTGLSDVGARLRDLQERHDPAARRELAATVALMFTRSVGLDDSAVDDELTGACLHDLSRRSAADYLATTRLIGDRLRGLLPKPVAEVQSK